MQGVIKSYDPVTGDGAVACDTDLASYDLAADALAGSVFRMVRQGQRVVFELDGNGRATHLRLGSETDMGTPGFAEDIPTTDTGTPAANTANEGPTGTHPDSTERS